MTVPWPHLTDMASNPAAPSEADMELAAIQAEEVLHKLAGVFSRRLESGTPVLALTPRAPDQAATRDEQSPNLEARYRALVEQIPAVVFMAYLDRGIGEAYVSPQIEASLGFSQAEWLEDPVRWYSRLHPDDKQRWVGALKLRRCF